MEGPENLTWRRQLSCMHSNCLFGSVGRIRAGVGWTFILRPSLLLSGSAWGLVLDSLHLEAFGWW